MSTHRRTALNGERAAEPLAMVPADMGSPPAAEPAEYDSVEFAHTARRRRRSWPILLLLLVVAAGGATVWWWRTHRETVKVVRATYTVKRADLPIVVRDSGSLDSLRSEIIKSKVEGQATIISIVPEGTIVTEEDVKSGKILVELDSSDIREKLTQQEVTFASAEAAYKQAKEASDIEKSAGESKVNVGAMEVRFGKMDLEAYVGQKLADDALAGRIDLSKLAMQLYEEATAHRGRVEAELAAALTEVGRALKEEKPPADSPLPKAGKTDAPGKGEGDVSQPGTQTHLLGGAALQKKRKLEADIGLAFEEFKRAADKVASYAGLKRLGIKSSQQLEAEQLALMRGQITLEQALTARELFLRYDLPKEAEKLLSGYTESQRELARIQARTRSALSVAEAEVKSTKAKFDLQQDRLAKLKAQLEYCTMKATCPGLVVYGTSGGERHWRGNPIEVGGTVYERQEIIKMPDISALVVKIRVHESVVDKVKVDLPARIRVDAFRNRKLTGKVLKVAVLPNTSSSWLNPDLKEYDTQLSLEGDAAGLKPGMSAEVEIDVKAIKNVLQVPVQAVANQNGNTVVHVLHGDGSEEVRQVTLGESNEDVVEVHSGLEVGEHVLLEAPQTVSVKDEDEKNKKKLKEDEEETNGGAPPAPPSGRQPADRPGPPGKQPGGKPGRERPKPSESTTPDASSKRG